MRRVHRKSWNIPGHAHELTFTCYHRYPFLSKDRTRRWMLDAMQAARQKHDLALIAYVLMPEHAHLLLFPRRSTYSMQAVLSDIKQPVARRALAYLRRNDPDWLPRLMQKRGDKIEYHFWQRGGGYDRNVIKPTILESMVDYIHNNPVRRGLADRPTDWLWSSARWYAGLDDSPLAMDPLE